MNIKSIIQSVVIIFSFFGLTSNLYADYKVNEIVKEVKLASKVYIDLKGSQSDKKIEINVEHPRLYLGKSYSSAYEYKGVKYSEVYSATFDGLSVRVDIGSIIINDMQYLISQMPGSIWISDDLKVVKIDQKLCEFKKITYENRSINKEIFDKTLLDNGYTIEVLGGYSDSSSGIGISQNHYILDRHGIVLKVWGDKLFVWGKYYGMLSEISNSSKIIRIDMLTILK